MRKIIILITFLLFGICVNAQTATDTQTVTKTESYNRWAISAEFGNHMVADKSASSMSKLGSFGADLRYNINPKFGIGLSSGIDFIDLANYTTNSINLNYARTNLEAYVNVFNMVDIYTDRFTTLFHGGPGISFINTNNSYTQTLPNVRGGLTVLYRITHRMSLKGDISVTANYAENMTLDGSYVQKNSGVNSMIANASVGLSFSLGKNKKHFDNYVPEKIVPSVTNNTYVTNVDSSYVKNYINNNYKTFMIDTTQYVFFENDKYEIRNSELNAIYKTFINLTDHTTYTLVVKGLASPSEDLTLSENSDNYNMKLSENRANTLKQKFVDMGISPDRITIKYFGKDKGFPKKSDFDVARRVELIISTNKK